MSFIMKKHLSRRTVLRGMGVSIALPLMESMIPAQTASAKTAASSPSRLACIENVHGSAGASPYGIEKNLWAPAEAGHNFDLSPTSLRPLEPLRDYVTIVSNTDCRMAEALSPSEVGGDHSRSSAVFLTQSHPKQTQGSDVYCGTSVDQLYAKQFGQDTPIPSIQTSIEALDMSGGCLYNYNCVYMDTISWASPTRPLPMVRNPRAVFEQLFGSGRTAEERAERRKFDNSVLDWVSHEVSRLKLDLGADDRRRLDDHLSAIREIERRIQRTEEHNASGEARELPNAPIAAPDSFEDHLDLMFDLQVLAFAGGVTRVSALKLCRDVSLRVWPATGVKTGFHNASHYLNDPKLIEEYAKINTYHVSLMGRFMQRLKDTPDGDGNLLDHTAIIYGSAMGNGNLHNHKRCPLFLAGHANGAMKGNLHVKAPDGTPMANVFLTLLNRIGMDINSFGDSTGEIDI
jgi:uncharacterized protein DUF1552